ncbi:MAG: methyltransferase domain-containing protein [Hyphomonadaceae bacterium]
MFKQEAAWIAARIAAIDAADVGTIANVGSSTAEFRTKRQPWVDAELFAPLRARKVPVVHVDLKQEDGVDLVADILSEEGYTAVKAHKPRTVLLCNILEHVHEPDKMTRRAFDLVEPGGRLIVSVPRSYPHHRDPFDTMYRPTPQQVASLVPEAKLTEGEILPTEYHWHDIWRNPKKLQRKRALWLFVKYKVTMVVLQKAA